MEYVPHRQTPVYRGCYYKTRNTKGCLSSVWYNRPWNLSVKKYAASIRIVTFFLRSAWRVQGKTNFIYFFQPQTIPRIFFPHLFLHNCSVRGLGMSSPFGTVYIDLSHCSSSVIKSSLIRSSCRIFTFPRHHVHCDWVVNCTDDQVYGEDSKSDSNIFTSILSTFDASL